MGKPPALPQTAFFLARPTTIPFWPAIQNPILPVGEKAKTVGIIYDKLVWVFWWPVIQDCRCITAYIPATCTTANNLKRSWTRCSGLTVVIDKGMNSEGNFAWIDDHARIHFVTTYSTYFSQELATTTLDRFEPVDTAKNIQLIEDENPENQLLGWHSPY